MVISVLNENYACFGFKCMYVVFALGRGCFWFGWDFPWRM